MTLFNTDGLNYKSRYFRYSSKRYILKISAVGIPTLTVLFLSWVSAARTSPLASRMAQLDSGPPRPQSASWHRYLHHHMYGFGDLQHPLGKIH